MNENQKKFLEDNLERIARDIDQWDNTAVLPKGPARELRDSMAVDHGYVSANHVLKSEVFGALIRRMGWQYRKDEP